MNFQKKLYFCFFNIFQVIIYMNLFSTEILRNAFHGAKVSTILPVDKFQ